MNAEERAGFQMLVRILAEELDNNVRLLDRVDVLETQLAEAQEEIECETDPKEPEPLPGWSSVYKQSDGSWGPLPPKPPQPKEKGSKELDW